MPRIELDELYWGPDWNPKSGAEFRRLRAAATEGEGEGEGEGEAWVADGNYGAVRSLLWRALRRTLARSLTGQPLWHGNRESLRRDPLDSSHTAAPESQR